MAASRSHAQWLVLLALCSLATAALSLEAGQDRKCANHEPTLDEEDAVCALQRAPLKQGGEKKALVKQHTAESAVMVQSSRAVAKAGAKTMVDKKKSTASKQGRFPWGWTGSNDSPGGDDEAVYDPQKDNEEEAVYDPKLDNEAEAVYDPTLDNEEEAVYDPTSDNEEEAVYNPKSDNEEEAVYDPTSDNEAEAVYDPTLDNEAEAVYDPKSDNEEEAVYDPQSDNEAEAVYDPKKDDDEAVAGNTWMAKLHSLDKGVASKAAPKAASAMQKGDAISTGAGKLAAARAHVEKASASASKQGRFPWGWTGSNDSPGGDDEAVYDPQKDNEEEAVYDPTLDNEAEAVYDPTLDNEEEAVYNPKSDDEADKEAEAVYDPTLDNEAEAVYDPTLDNEAEAVYDPKSDNEEEAVYDPQSDNEEEAVYDPQSDNEAEAVYDPKKDDDEAVAGNTWMAKLHSLGKGVASKAAPKAASAV